MTNVDSREIILDILLEILEQDGYSHVVLNQALSKYQYLSKIERGFISRITNGTLEYLIQIDYVINQYSKIKISKMKPLIRTVLRMSVYQIIYMDRIPDSAVCNEAVKLTVKRRFQGLKGFVNGVLRTIIREKDHLNWPTDSVRYSIPDWILSIWRTCYEPSVIEQMLQSFLEPKKLMVRCNRNQTDQESILKSLKDQGVLAEQNTMIPTMLQLSNIDYIEDLEAFSKGWIQVQDISSAFVGEIVSPDKDSYVIDVCSAPGGKSLHIADLLQGTGLVEARDLTDYKVRLIDENITRSGLHNIRSKVQDALLPDLDSIEKADVVLADLPCSGLGIIGRKPDIKYKMTPEKLASLAQLQKDILSVVYQYVKPGGILVYSTCTINPEENQRNAEWFLENFPFDPVNIEGRLGKEIREDTMKNGWIQLLPGIHPCDGFFISVFRKNV